MARLPTPGRDENDWGNLLNEFLAVAHNKDGTLKENLLSAGTMAELKTLKPKIGDTVLLKGYHTPGDGGGGLFYGDPTDATSGGAEGDDGMYIKPVNSEGRWIRHFHDTIYGEWFGAKGDGIANDQPAIQKTIDFALQHLIQQVRLGDGVFRIEDTLHLGYGYDFSSVSLIGTGKRFTGGKLDFGGTAIVLARKDAAEPLIGDRPAIAVQGARYSEIKRLSIRGENNAHIEETFLTDFQQKATLIVDPTKWVDPDLLAFDSRYAPYAAIAIDPYAGPKPESGYPDVVYPTWLSQTNATIPQYNKFVSSGVHIEDVEILGFIVGIVNQPCDYDGNGDFTKIHKCSFTNLKYGISIGNSQSRNVSIRDCEYAFLHTFLTTAKHGRQVGRLDGPIDNISGGASYQFADIPSLTRTGSLHFKHFYFETQIRFGVLGTANAAFNAPVIFESCFLHSAVNEFGYNPNALIEAGAISFRFSGCIFKFDRFLNLMTGFDNKVVFDSCTVEGLGNSEAYSSAEMTAKNYLCGGLFCLTPPVLLGGINGMLVTEHGYTPYQFSDTISEYSGTIRKAHPGIRSIVHQGARHLSLTPGNYSSMFAPIHTTKPIVWIDKNAHLSNITPNGDAVTFVNRSNGQYQYTMSAGDLLYDQPTATILVVENVVPAVDGATVTAKALTNVHLKDGQRFLNISPATIDGSQHFILFPCSVYKTDYAYRGNTAVGSTVMTNVRRPDGYGGLIAENFSLGDLLHYSYPHEQWDRLRPFPEVTRIVAVDADTQTITVDQQAVATVTDFTIGISMSW